MRILGPEPSKIKPRQTISYRGGKQKNICKDNIPPFDIVIGNTHLDTEKETVEQVLIDISKNMPDDMKLEEDLVISEIEKLVPEREGYIPWTASWRVRVSSKFKDHILRPESIPLGWTNRKIYPKRQKSVKNAAKRQNTGNLDPYAAAAVLNAGLSNQNDNE